ncbi:MAG: DUF1223 domain-containing protein, partial [Bacteroidia bacterium]|nr:DUF1223 domain-containing protein [Bacteroidia bacterium]
SSEGCSSCPPGDKLMEQIVDAAKKDNRPIYLLAFHVDYWDFLGWKDTLAKPEYTKRQYAYRDALKTESIYTPQAIINGKYESTGSNSSKIMSFIDQEASKTPECTLTCTATKVNAEKSLTVNYEISGNHENSTVNFAVLLKTVTHKIKNGENRGETLTHIKVVRSLVQDKPTGNSGQKTISIPGNPKDYEVVVFVQKDKSMEILNSCMLQPAE